MSAFLLFGRNLLETGVVTVTSAVSTNPVTRLYDRIRSQQWLATSNATQDIDIDTVSASYTHVGFVNANLSTAMEIYRGAAFPPATLTLTVPSLTTDPYLADLGGTFTERYVRLRILSGGVAPALGELFLGAPRTVTLPPFVRNAGRGTMGNVQRDASPAGYSWGVKRGSKRYRLAFGWTGMTDAEYAIVELAYDDIDQGTKSMLLQDELGRVFWVNCVTPALAPVPLGGGLNELAELAFEEAL